MNPEVEKLIRLSVATGKISEKNKATILRKAKSLGENPDEVEMIIDGEETLLNKKRSNIDKAAHPVMNDISEPVNINLIQAVASFINNYKIVKYALIFFLINLLFFLLTLLI